MGRDDAEEQWEEDDKEEERSEGESSGDEDEEERSKEECSDDRQVKIGEQFSREEEERSEDPIWSPLLNLYDICLLYVDVISIDSASDSDILPDGEIYIIYSLRDFLLAVALGENTQGESAINKDCNKGECTN